MIALREAIWISVLTVVPAFLTGAVVGMLIGRSRFVSTALRRLDALWLGVPAFWWLVAFVPGYEFNETKTLYLIGCAVAVLTALMVVREERASPIFTRDAALLRETLIVCLLRPLVTVTMLLATLHYLGLGFFELGQPEFGMEIAEGVRDGLEFQRLIWAPFAFLFILLFALSLISETLGLSARATESTEP
jgi:ABC-type dipeptide/oligopeptide/nickel transport system permease subunit